MAIKSIRPIQPISSNMPSKVIAPIGAPAKKDSLSSLRPGGGLPALPPIGDEKPKDTGSRDSWASTRLSPKLTEAWSSMGKFMPSTIVSRSGKKFNEAYVSGFSSYGDFFGGLQADFGAGELKEYKTTQGTRNLYEYQYQNFLRYGTIDGPKVNNEFSFRDGRWWTTQKPRAAYSAIVDDALSPDLAEHALSTDERDKLYHIAKKQGLTQEQYTSLYKSTFAKKYFTAATAAISPVINTLITGNNTIGDVSRTARYGSVFGNGSPGIAFLKDYRVILPAFSSQFGAAIAQLASSGVSYGLGSLLGVSPGKMSLTPGILPGLLSAVIGSATSNDWRGFQKRFEDAMSGTIRVIGAAGQGIIRAIVGGGGTGINYDLVNSNGKIIDHFADITSKGDREGIKQVADDLDIHREQAAAILGALYRWRVLKAYSGRLNAYSKQLSLTEGYFKDVSLMEF